MATGRKVNTVGRERERERDVGPAHLDTSRRKPPLQEPERRRGHGEAMDAKRDTKGRRCARLAQRGSLTQERQEWAAAKPPSETHGRHGGGNSRARCLREYCI